MLHSLGHVVFHVPLAFWNTIKMMSFASMVIKISNFSVFIRIDVRPSLRSRASIAHLARNIRSSNNPMAGIDSLGWNEVRNKTPALLKTITFSTPLIRLNLSKMWLIYFFCFSSSDSGVGFTWNVQFGCGNSDNSEKIGQKTVSYAYHVGYNGFKRLK